MIHLPVADLGSAADRKLLDHAAQDMREGEEGQHAVRPGDVNLLLVHVGMQGRHSSDDVLVCQHHSLGVACTSPPPAHHA